MASTSTVNSWLEELAQSFLPTKRPSTKGRQRRLVDTFRRRVRHHTFGRTNQFDVEDRLTGLEEKFQVLDRDDLSDTLYQYRVELNGHEQRWLPDILDLLLRLSKDPIGATSVTTLYDLEPRASTPAQLRWADIELDDPFDQNDQIWREPVFSDLSSDEDNIETSLSPISPTNIGQALERRNKDLLRTQIEPFEQRACTVTDNFSNSLLSESHNEVTEVQLIRESLFMLQGFPTTLFIRTNGDCRLRSQVCLKGINTFVVQDLLTRMSAIRKSIENVRVWTAVKTPVVYIQVIQREFSDIVLAYMSWVNSHIDQLLRPTSKVIASILQTVNEAEENAKALLFVSDVVQHFDRADPVTCLDSFYQKLYQQCYSKTAFIESRFLQIFIKALHAYILPLRMWLQNGRLESNSSPFFIRISSTKLDASGLWREWYEIIENGPARAPVFLSAFLHEIFACGKTSAFLKLVAIDQSQSTSEVVSTELDHLLGKIQSAAEDEFMPFPAAFEALLSDCFKSILGSRTKAMKRMLNTCCGMENALEALEFLYLRKDSVVMDNVEKKIFPRIDNCIATWNDRFLVADILEENFASISHIDAGAIMVHSAHTSSRSMESRRRSVKILAALAIEYRLPWPVANIIPKDSMASYRRIALHLTQLRRVKYILERVTYVHLQQQPISENIGDQKYAQLMVFILLQFINTLYDHFTTAMITPITSKMRIDLKAAPTIDHMMSVHVQYITKLEHACLTAKQLKMLRDTLVGLLDMCIRFADLVQSPANSQRRASDDFEASSFISAQSQRKRRRGRAAQPEEGEDSEDDDDDEDDGDGDGEGYSTFIVLDTETSAVKEIKKLELQFRRQLDFFIAGLRGVGKGGESMEQFEVLAGRLEWKKDLEEWRRADG